MAHVYLDTNYVIETIGLRRSNVESERLSGHDLYLSPLTIHIVCYSFKIDIPSKKVDDFIKQVHLVNFTEELTSLALVGPTDDFEDNIQLHSSAKADCDYFLTNDEELLKMKFFGKVKIASTL